MTTSSLPPPADDSQSLAPLLRLIAGRRNHLSASPFETPTSGYVPVCCDLGHLDEGTFLILRGPRVHIMFFDSSYAFMEGGLPVATQQQIISSGAKNTFNIQIIVLSGPL